ncbi:MAG: S53 family peptidase [Mycobacteriales bacterium]
MSLRGRTLPLLTAFTLLAGSAGAALAASPASAASAQEGSSPLVPARAAVLPGLSHARALGPTPGSQQLTIGVALRLPNPAGEQALYQELYTKGSPLYHDFLTPQQYAARFAVPASVAARTEAWLRSGGLRIETVDIGRDYITAGGTVAEVSALMRTRFEDFRVGPIDFLANVTPPWVPANLPLTTILGLNTLNRMWTEYDIARVDGGLPLTAHPAQSGGGSFVGLLSPENLWGVYNLPSSNQGQGQTAGLFGEGMTNDVVANLRIYERTMHLPQVPVRVVHTEPGTPTQYGDNSDVVEWYLDSDAITGMAPKLTQLDLYFSKSLFDADVAASFANWASDPNGPLQMNASFGECETSPGNAIFGPLAQAPFYYGTELGDELEPAAEPVLLQANLEGRTLFSSAGDTGGSCPAVVAPVVGAGNGLTPQPVPEPNYPAVSPHVVGVGGTVVDTQGSTAPNMFMPAKRANEVSWTYSGGGPSRYLAEPPYQKPVSAVNQPCISQPNGSPYPAGTICRGVPDIADMSGTIATYQANSNVGAANFYYYEADMALGGEGGTSLSSPLAVGMWSRIQAAAPTAKGLGFANESFYSIGLNPTKYKRDFFDITQSETPAGNFYNQPAPGWDYVSGWGAMNVANLMMDLDGRLTPTRPLPQQPLPVAATGCPVFTSPLGNANNGIYPAIQDPMLDITQASLRTTGTNLIATIYGPTLSTALPNFSTGGSAFYTFWTYGTTTYFATAQVSPTGAVSYSDGNTNPVPPSTTGSYNIEHSIQGSFSNGLITMTVPLAQVGNPPKGAQLLYPYAMSQNMTTSVGVAIALTEDVATAPQPGQAAVVGAPCTQAEAVALHLASASTPRSSSSAGVSSTGQASSSGRLAYTGAPLVPIGLVALGLITAGYLLRRLRGSIPG